MTSFCFLSNCLSDPSFETFLKDTHRYFDYRDVKLQLLPQLIKSIKPVTEVDDCQFTGTNRFEGQFPALRIQSPIGFSPEVIHIEFPPRRGAFCVKQSGQTFTLPGIENLGHHLRVLLVMGFAHRCAGSPN